MLIDWLFALWHGNALSILMFSPVVGLVLVFLVKSAVLARQLAIFSTFFTLILSLGLWLVFSGTNAQFQFVEKYQWVKGWGISYHLGIDGISLLMLVLTAFLFVVAAVSSFPNFKSNHFFALLLCLQIGTLGVFCALDAVLFYVFWEWVLIPLYFLIRLWGDSNNTKIALQFFLITMFGSVLMLVAFWAIAIEYQNTFQELSFSFSDWQNLSLAPAFQLFWFWGLFIAFGIKMPLVPMHIWQPTTYLNSPLGVRIVLGGILSKMGAYGFIRLAMPFFPLAFNQYAQLLWWLCALGMVYASLLAFVQTNIIRLIAYASIAHLSLIGLGIFSTTADGLQGAVVFMFNHGIIVGTLFLLEDTLCNNLNITSFDKPLFTLKTMPWFSFMFIFTALAAAGLPGLNGFVGEVFIFNGIFTKSWPVAMVAVLTMVLSAVYMLKMVQKICFGAGEVHQAQKTLSFDLTFIQKTGFFLLLLLMVVLGLFPALLLDPIKQNVISLISIYSTI